MAKKKQLQAYLKNRVSEVIEKIKHAPLEEVKRLSGELRAFNEILDFLDEEG